MRRRLTLDRIEKRPKAVGRGASFRVACRLSDRQEEFVLSLLDAVTSGTALPKGAYRRSSGPDTLLLRDGIMHLHLGHSGSRELLYLVQYADAVVLLEISDHYHFTTKPIGATLRSIHAKRIEEWEREG